MEKLGNEHRARLKLKLYNEVLESLREAYGWHAKFTERICSLVILKQAYTKKCTAKLPVLKLATFEGEFSKWNHFWTSFSNSVDNNEELEDSEKFSYLLQSLVSKPKEMIKGLEITDANHTVALNILRDRYDNPTKRTHAIFRKFYNLPAPNHNAKELRNFLNQYRQVREQMKLITDINAAELVAKSTLMKKF